MIDPHVHLRDGKQAYKESVRHGLFVADRAGLDGVFEMPNTDPPLISRKEIEERIKLADQAGIPVFHGIFAGLTAFQNQIEEVVDVSRCFFPRVIGLKLYAGRSTGNLSVCDIEEQKNIFSVLVMKNYKGVVAVHCEKESCFKNDLWNPSDVYTHCLSRPPESEVESVKDLIQTAKQTGFTGTLHICHISVPQALFEIENARKDVSFKITCGITPHHIVFNSDNMRTQAGHFLKINPPLRQKDNQITMLKLLLEERIDWIETDHAPHGLADKPLASGIPVLPFYPHFVKWLGTQGFDDRKLENLTHNNICRVFGIEIKNSKKPVDYNLAAEYPFDPFMQFYKNI